MAEPVDNHEADVFVSQLWRHIYARMAALLHPHAREHEPGGKDPVSLPLGFLTNVVISGPTIGQGIVCSAADNAGGTWVNGAGAGGGGGGPHTACLMIGLPPPATTIVGPKNMSGAAYNILAVNAISDGEVAGSVPGLAFSFAAGGGEDGATGAPLDVWADGDRLTPITIDTWGSDGTYLTITWTIVNG